MPYPHWSLAQEICRKKSFFSRTTLETQSGARSQRESPSEPHMKQYSPETTHVANIIEVLKDCQVTAGRRPGGTRRHPIAFLPLSTPATNETPNPEGVTPLLPRRRWNASVSKGSLCTK